MEHLCVFVLGQAAYTAPPAVRPGPPLFELASSRYHQCKGDHGDHSMPSCLLCKAVLCWTGQADDQKQKLVQQLGHLDASYNGGLVAYIKNAKQLLQDSREGQHCF